MPAIQPDVLQREIEALLEDVGEPGRFVRECMKLLEYYADRTRRSGRIPAEVASERVLRVPRPVLRTLCAAIHRRGRSEEDVAWLQVAWALWEKGYREARLIAICMLREADLEDLPGLAGAWGEESDDSEILRALAEEGLRPLREQDSEAYLGQIGAWLAADRQQALALHALTALLDTQGFDDFPRIFRLMQGSGRKIARRANPVFRALMERLARRSPHETAAFLLEEIKREPSGAGRLVEWALAELPPNLQVELRAARARAK